MKPHTVLVTGSSGLIGSEAVEHFDRQGCEVHGVDNNMRRIFFGDPGDTTWNLNRLRNATRNFTHHDLDIRDRTAMDTLFRSHRFDLIIHCAAQPSHDKARDIPILDFEVNALGTVNLLEATRLHCPEAVFVFLSTNKVYGDAPNEVPLKELETRWEYARSEDYNGISENCRIDRTLHSLFGASKASADLMAQEYGRYFRHEGLYLSRWLPNRSVAFRRRASRLPFLSGKGRHFGRDLFRFWLQGQAGPRQHP